MDLNFLLCLSIHLFYSQLIKIKSLLYVVFLNKTFKSLLTTFSVQIKMFCKNNVAILLMDITECTVRVASLYDCRK